MRYSSDNFASIVQVVYLFVFKIKVLSSIKCARFRWFMFILQFFFLFIQIAYQIEYFAILQNIRFSFWCKWYCSTLALLHLSFDIRIKQSRLFEITIAVNNSFFLSEDLAQSVFSLRWQKIKMKWTELKVLSKKVKLNCTPARNIWENLIIFFCLIVHTAVASAEESPSIHLSTKNFLLKLESEIKASPNKVKQVLSRPDFQCDMALLEAEISFKQRQTDKK